MALRNSNDSPVTGLPKSHLHIAVIAFLCFLARCASAGVCQLPETQQVDKQFCQGPDQLQAEAAKSIVDADERCKVLVFKIREGKDEH